MNKFTETLKITNVEQSTYASGYVTGFKTTGGNEREAIWDTARALYKKTRVINEPPSELTNLYWVRNELDAKEYLETWLDWMLKRRISFSVSYAKGKDWHVCKHVSVDFPHQTNSQATECMIEKIRKAKNDNKVDVTLIFLDELSTTPYRVQDTYKSTYLDEWQDTYTEGVTTDIIDNF